MATSKIKAIRGTLRKAVDYIVNPDKTNDGQLVFSHGCSPETADIEMQFTAKQGTGIGDRIAYHLMQSFSPEDDISPEKALELGKEFARKVTGGKHEFVVTTHIDKEHIHNHIIFNSVDYVNHRKYHSDKKDKFRIRDINDEICLENNLSVLPKYDAKRKRTYENTYKKESDGWRKKLKTAIDSAVRTSATFDDFLLAMELEGYEIKQGKHISFRAPEQKRFVRAKSIGEDYSEEAIRRRIESDENITVSESGPKEAYGTNAVRGIQNPKQKTAFAEKKPFFQKRINLLVDISKNLKAQQSRGYEQALVRSNINTLVKTMNFLIEHKLTTSDDFTVYEEGKEAEFSLYRKDIGRIENELLDLSERIKFTQNYKKNAAVYYESKRNPGPEFFREHEEEIVLFKASEIYFDRKQLNPKTLNLGEMFEHYKELKAEQSALMKRRNSVKKELNELDIIKKNIAEALNLDLEKEEKKKENTWEETLQKKGFGDMPQQAK